MKRIFQILAISLSIIIIIGALLGYKYYKYIYGSNIDLRGESKMYLYIPSGSDYEDVVTLLEKDNILKNIDGFHWVAQQKKYPQSVKSGRYRVTNGMSNNHLINILRAGLQEPVSLTLNNINTRQQLAGRIGRKIESDSIEILQLLNNEEFASRFDMNSTTIFAAFIPDTYELYWNSPAEKVLERLIGEYQKFWNEERKSKAKKLNMSMYQVSTLASIVQAEQSKFKDEKPRIAGLYINRLRIGMPLQSDPTIIYAWGDFSIQRVYSKHLAINSPFNTYKNKGLPPAPIRLPSVSSIDAVLNYEKHNFVYMCAKADFSGYHSFSETYEQHQVYAQQYHKALNDAKIK